jgi:hypothetical protein
MKKMYLYAYAAAVFFAVAPLQAEHINPFIMPSARAAGFGGIHAAQGDDISAIFSNPASFSGLEKQFSAAELTISLYGPVFQFLNLVNQSSDDLDISSLEQSGKLSMGLDVGGPLALGWVDKGFGFGIFNRSVIDVRTESFVVAPVASEEILLVGGYSFRVLERDPHVLDLGFLGKGFYRGTVYLEAPLDDITEMFADHAVRPASSQYGLGVDLGIKYTFANTFSMALAGYDVFSPARVTRYDEISDYGEDGEASYATVKPRLALGFLYRIRNDFVDRHFSDFIMMLDYRDFLDLFYSHPRNPLLNISFGIEFGLLRVMRIRAGIAEALPSLGFGIDMHILIFDFAVRGREMGLDPWEQSVYAVDLGLLFRY